MSAPRRADSVPLVLRKIRSNRKPRLEKPPQVFSRTLASNRTRIAFFSSKWFLTINGLPPVPRQAGLATHPDQGLKEEVPPYLHILRCASRLATAKNDVLARGFEVLLTIL